MKIRNYSEFYTNEEPEYKDFIARRDFINTTGVFVTPEHYNSIYSRFKTSGVSVLEFVRGFEEKYSICLLELPLSDETIKFEMDDDCLGALGMYADNDDPIEDDEPNVMEVINSLSLAHYHERKMCEEMSGMYEKICEEYKYTCENLKKMCDQLMTKCKEYEKTCRKFGDLCLSFDDSAVKAD